MLTVALGSSPSTVSELCAVFTFDGEPPDVYVASSSQISDEYAVVLRVPK